MKPFLLALAMLTALIVTGTQGQPMHWLDGRIERRIDSLLALMTVEEKLGQLNQVGPRWNLQQGPDASAQAELVRKGRIGSFLYLTGAWHTRQIQRIAVEESRLKIPLLFGLDVIHGYRTTFPIPLALACTWNPELVEQTARVAALEATAAGVHWTFAPMVDIARDPRWGRIVEGAGEDPFLGAAMAVAQVKGFQGTDLRNPTTLLACAKHFAAYGGAEAGRDYNTVDLSERTMREIYLPPFKAAVEAGVGTLMSAFNDIGGIPASANKWLMTEVLRSEWKFKGFVVSDYAAVEQLINHGIAATREDAGIFGLTAGVDMDMVDTIYTNELVSAARAGRLPMVLVDEAVRRVLRVKFAIGLFDNPYRNCDTTLAEKVFMQDEHLKLALKAAHQSIVLLKNDKNILPLTRDIRSIAVIGPLADIRLDMRGPWSGPVEEGDFTSVLTAVKRRSSLKTSIRYAKGCEVEKDSGYNAAEAVRIAKQADVAIIVAGESANMSGEAASRANIDLPGRQKELITAVHATGTPVILVLLNGRPLTLAWETAHLSAIVEAWFPGTSSGNAIADVLFGEVNPSGKLAVSFPRTVGQAPLYYNHKNTGRPPVETDKYTSKYLDVPNTPLFPFGFGLSYTTYAYSNLTLSSPSVKSGEVVTVTVDVTNTGLRDGEEIVQLYIRDEVASVTRPVQELKGFQRVALTPGEKKRVEFTVKPEHLEFYNLTMTRVLEPGWFTVMVGGNSAEVLQARFEVR